MNLFIDDLTGEEFWYSCYTLAIGQCCYIFQANNLKDAEKYCRYVEELHNKKTFLQNPEDYRE